MAGKGGSTKAIGGQEEIRLHPIVAVAERLDENVRIIKDTVEAGINALRNEADSGIERRRSDALKIISDMLKKDNSAEGKAIKELLHMLAAEDEVKIAGKPDRMEDLKKANLVLEAWAREFDNVEKVYISTYALSDLGRQLVTQLEVGKEKRT